MKEIIKKILKFFGLYHPLLNWRFRIKYKDINHYDLVYGAVHVKYSAEDLYSKRWFYPRYANDKVHEPAMIDFFLKNLSDSTIFCDVGANLGFFTCIGGMLCKQGQVHAFEMDPKCIPLINRNVKINKFENVVVNNYAVSDKVGSEIIPKLSQPDSRLMIKGAQENGVNETMVIEAITLDEYFLCQKKSLPNVIKIDAEGAEIKILKGMQKVMESSKDLKILVEIHCNKLPNFGATFQDVLNILAKNGFIAYLIDSHRLSNLKFVKIDNNSSLKGNVMVFAQRE